jgi:hypothetical protein
MSGSSQNSRLQEWEILLMKARAYEVELAGIVSLREDLETAYSRVKATRSMRDTLQASSRDASKRIKETLAAGKEAAAGLRRVVKSRRPIG